MYRRKLSHSQNFLKNQRLVRRLLDRSSINANDIVYEIGPGKGIITRELAKVCKKVIGVEVDKKLYTDLVKKFSKNKKIEIILHNFLTFNLPNKETYKIFANIPFNLTADIINKITKTKNPPSEAFLIIQREAALKFSGQPYYKESQFSLLLKPFFELKIIAKLKKTDFWPQPKVNAVLLQIKKRKEPIVKQDQAQLYKDFIVYAFNQWKPTLKQALRKIFTGAQYNKLSYNLNFNINSRPTDLNFEQWIAMFDYFITGVSEEKKKFVLGSEQRLKKQQNKLRKIHRTRIKK